MATYEVLAQKRVVLGVSGSIAAYKAVAVASMLTQAGADVDVAMTPEATKLVRPLSFQAITHRSVQTKMFRLRAEADISHVALAHEADVVLIAPATAHTIGKLALGLADDVLSTTVLATRAPLVIAPAMDAGMYDNPAVRDNVERLRDRGAIFIEPETGRMASGLVGQGRLAEPAVIVDTLRLVLGRSGDLSGQRLVVTAGGTQEAIDPVRFISNRSSGKMGYAIAEAARDRGAAVVLISAPTTLAAPLGVELRHVVSAAEMDCAVRAAIDGADYLIMAAAVSDFRPEQVADQKIKKDGQELLLRLAPTTDILASTATLAGGRLVRVGFAAESGDLAMNAQAKLERKRLDLVVGNDISLPESGFGADTNQVLILDHQGNRRDLPALSKRAVAHEILNEALRVRQERGG